MRQYEGATCTRCKVPIRWDGEQPKLCPECLLCFYRVTVPTMPRWLHQARKQLERKE